MHRPAPSNDGGAEFALASARAEHRFEPAYVPAADVPVEIRAAERTMAIADDPAYGWIRATWDGMTPDPRCPMTTAADPAR
jgi:hypothetical protein